MSEMSELLTTAAYTHALVQVKLSVDNHKTHACLVKAPLEKTVLGQVAAHIKAVLQPQASFISICLDLDVIAKLQLAVTPRSVGQALLKHSKLKLKTEHIRWPIVLEHQHCHFAHCHFV